MKILVLLDVQCDELMDQDNFAAHSNKQVFIKCYSGFFMLFSAVRKNEIKRALPQGAFSPIVPNTYIKELIYIHFVSPCVCGYDTAARSYEVFCEISLPLSLLSNIAQFPSSVFLNSATFPLEL